MVPIRIGRDYGPSVEIVSGLRDGDTVITTVSDGVHEGATVRPQRNAQAEQNATGRGNQPPTTREPDSGPNQYGDQSIVNEQLEGTNNQGNKGQHNGTSDQGQNVKQHGPQQQQGSKKGSNQ